MKERLHDAQRHLARADPAEALRTKDEISDLERQIGQQELLIASPEVAKRYAATSIERRLELVRRPEVPAKAEVRTRFINPPPMVAPSYFQDRHVETGLIGDFLKDDALRMMTVVGRGGVGKTATVCRLLKALESGHLPDDGEVFPLDGIVYLSAAGAHRLNLPNIFTDLSELVSEESAKRLRQVYQDGRASTRDKMLSLLEDFPSGRTILLLDNFEDAVDTETLVIKDAEVDEALRTVVDSPPHAVKVLLTTRVVPRSLLLAKPELQRRLDLDEGLPPEYAEEVLKARDPDGKLGLKTASKKSLAEAAQCTLGFPRALEAIAGILAADRDTTFEDLLADLSPPYSPSATAPRPFAVRARLSRGYCIAIWW